MANPLHLFLIVTKSNLGGAQRYVFDIARSLPKDSYRVTVITGQTGWLQEVCTAEGISSVTLPSLQRDISLFDDLRAFFALIGLFLKEKPDIVHLNSSKAGVLGALAARIAGVRKIIFTAHGWAFNESRSVFSRAFFWVAHAITMLLATATIANSQVTARQAPVQKGILTIPLGIERPQFLSRAEALEALQVQSGVTIGTIAELHRNKGIDVLIDATPYITDARVVIIGDGEEREKLVERARKNGAENSVHFAGYKEEAAKYLNAFDIFVLPSRTESFGYVLLEAGHAGLPVVASAVGGIPELIKENENGLLVQKENAHDLSAALQKLVHSQEMRTRLGRNMQTQTERFSLTAMIQRTKEVYER